MLQGACALGLLCSTPAVAQDGGLNQSSPETPAPTLYVTATAHLDTQWLWTIQTTIDEYIPSTLRDNFALFEKYPSYVFSFEGAFRYMLAREYYPDEYARLKEYVAKGRWHVCGSSVDAGDVNVPAPESLIRHILYGNGFFEREFGKRSCDIYLPDCFGFGYALPSVAAHCGLKGFSTQKLTWGSSVDIPFDIGVWEGVDGSAVVAALNPGDYVSTLRTDLSHDEEWRERITRLGEESGAYVGYKYFGVGDRGGAPDDESVAWLERSISGDGPVRVISRAADQLYRDLTPEQIARLPRYKGELLMTRHGTGCYTSQAPLKRWNRKNEMLADAAERASVAADWLGGAAYPRARLEESWVRFLWHQFHDDLTGTSIPQAYPFSWNDEIIALNQFAATLTNAVGTVARALDTRVEGTPLVVFNPLTLEREDVATARVRFPDRRGQAVRVFDADGRELPSQVRVVDGDEVEFLFLARVPSVGFAVFDVRPATEPCAMTTGLAVTESTLENGRYGVRLDDNGDVAGIFDKSIGRELLSSPARMALFHNTPDYWSEWEIRHEDITADPYAHVGAPAAIRIVERGPVRVTIEVTREVAGSTIVQQISLSAGAAGNRVELANLIHWRTPKTLLKATFPLTASKEHATYDLGFGVIERPTNTEKKYEVPAQQWADLTNEDGTFGVTVLNDCKYGWDKPDDHTLRLTLIHTPNEVEKDMGRHRMTYAIYGHAGDWRTGDSVTQGARLNQPLAAFQTVAHPGNLGKRFSLMSVDSSQVVVRALKKAEQSDEVVVRLQESDGEPARGVSVAWAAPIVSAREINGTEEAIGTADVRNGRLALDLEPYQPRTFALKLGPTAAPLTAPVGQPIKLRYDRDVVSFDKDRSDGDMDGEGHTLPAELLPDRMVLGDVPFTLGPRAVGEKNALTCRGQTILLPPGDFDRLYILAAATGGNTVGTFYVGGRPDERSIHHFTGWIGQADSLIVDGQLRDIATMAPAYLHRDPLAWVGTHRHDGAGDRNEPYVFCYLFKYALDLSKGAKAVTLPNDGHIRIFAMTAARNPNDDTIPAQHLYDRIDATYLEPQGGLYINPVEMTLRTDDRDARIFYTLDGSVPTESSPRYTAPVTLAATTRVRTRALRGGVLEDFVGEATFTFTKPRAAQHPAGVVTGLDYRYYEGKWTRLPDFEQLEPIKSGTTAGFDLAPRNRDAQFGFVFSGFVKVPQDGVYTFYTASDDGSRLYIGDVEVVNNDGLHGKRTKRGAIALGAGLHAIRVTHFERGGDDTLEVRYEGPGIEKTVIPADSLFCLSAGP